jgi:hexosaminidase
LSEGNLSIDKSIVLVNILQFQPAVAVIENALAAVFNIAVTRNDAPVGKANIKFISDPSLVADVYQIDVSAKGILVKAQNGAGAYYAAQSIRQMIWNSTSGLQTDTINLRLMTIKDKPNYAWRGFHLDVSRHFFTKEFILKIIDWLAYYKLNKLHLHLNDDQGWRVQIDQFPLLTETGAWRTFNQYDSTCMDLAKTDINYTIDTRFIKEVNGQTLYGGFYTKQDIRDIVAYATANYIEVVPEIDMPGHMSAAIRAYPQLSCVDSAGWGKEFSFPICPCKDEVMDFSFKVWDEIAELFRSRFVHIGCDEVEKGTWANSIECQAFMQQNNLKDVNEIQNWFVKKLQEHLEAKGKTVIAWDDVIDGNIDSKLTMMYWRDWVKDSPARCAANGNNIILTPASPFYMASVNNDAALQNLYEFNPADLYPAAVQDKVQGIQSCVWTEIVPSEAIFEQFVFPRLQALSEVCWSAGRSWYSFQVRMKPHFSYLDFNNIHYRRPGWVD